MTSIGGAFSKVCVDGYLYKFADYWNGRYLPLHITEFIACRLINNYGVDVQQVDIGYFNGVESCFIKMFDYDLVSLYSMKESTLNTDDIPERSISNHSLELYESMINYRNEYKFAFTQEELNDYLYALITMDLLIGNIDRHPGNIGFQFYKGKYYLAPMYDCGLSLWLTSSKSMAFRYNGRRLRPYKLINLYKDRLGTYIVQYCNLDSNIHDINKYVGSIYGSKYNSLLKDIECNFENNRKELLRWTSL